MDFDTVANSLCWYSLVSFMVMFLHVNSVLCTGLWWSPLGWVATATNLTCDVLRAFFPHFVLRPIAVGFYIARNTRNSFFQVQYVALVLSLHLVYTRHVKDALSVWYTPGDSSLPTWVHQDLPTWLTVLTLLCWGLASYTDPGTIDSSTYNRLSNIYPYDGVAYTKARMCQTCRFRKPARSKHCSVCNRCVFKFDHHCIWLNNCVGGLNKAHFLAFLMSTVALTVIMSVVYSAWLLKYITYEPPGQDSSVRYRYAYQILRSSSKRVLPTLVCCVLASLLLLWFCVFHIDIILTNETSNERFKYTDPDTIYWPCFSCWPRGDSDYRTVLSKWYDRGVWANMTETFCADHFIRATLTPCDSCCDSDLWTVSDHTQAAQYAVHSKEEMPTYSSQTSHQTSPHQTSPHQTSPHQTSPHQTHQTPPHQSHFTKRSRMYTDVPFGLRR